MSCGSTIVVVCAFVCIARRNRTLSWTLEQSFEILAFKFSQVFFSSRYAGFLLARVWLRMRFRVKFLFLFLFLFSLLELACSVGIVVMVTERS